MHWLIVLCLVTSSLSLLVSVRTLRDVREALTPSVAASSVGPMNDAVSASQGETVQPEKKSFTETVITLRSLAVRFSAPVDWTVDHGDGGGYSQTTVSAAAGEDRVIMGYSLPRLSAMPDMQTVDIANDATWRAWLAENGLQKSLGTRIIGNQSFDTYHWQDEEGLQWTRFVTRRLAPSPELQSLIIDIRALGQKTLSPEIESILSSITFESPKDSRN